METEYTELEGCMCEYIPEPLRDQIQLVADKHGVWTSQVVAAALKLGLLAFTANVAKPAPATNAKPGKIKQRMRSKLTGKGV